MKTRDVTVDYFTNYPEFADELARWSWSEWRLFYDARDRTFNDALSSYRERAHVNSLPMAIRDGQEFG